MTLWNHWLLLAEAQEPAATANPLGMAPLFLGLMILFYFIFLRPDIKREKTLKSMREGLKKNDRVVTTGGIFGVVTNVQRESNEVTIKVDETTNTKLRVTLESIARVLVDAPAEGGSPTASGA